MTGREAAMAARKKSTRAPDQEPELELSVDDALEQEVRDTLATIAGSDTLRLQVKRLLPHDQQGIVATLESTMAPDIVQFVTDNFGPGKYAVFAIDSRGKYQPGMHVTLNIPKDALRNPVSRDREAAPARSSGEPSMLELMMRLDERQQRREDAARADRNALITAAVGVLPAVLSALKSTPPRSLSEEINAMGGLKQLLGDRPAGGEGVEALMKGLELGQSLAAGGNSPEGWRAIVAEGLRAVSAIASTRPQIAPQAPAPTPAQIAAPAAPAAAPAAAPVPTTAPETQTKPTTKGEEPLQLTGAWKLYEPILRSMAADLVQFSDNEVDAETAAGALLGKIPTAVYRQISLEQLEQLVTAEGWWQYVVRFEPQLRGRNTFVTAVRQVMIEAWHEWAQERDRQNREAATDAAGKP